MRFSNNLKSKGECHVDQQQFSRMVTSFPFIETVLAEMDAGKDFVRAMEDIQVRQADEKLLRAQPLDLKHSYVNWQHSFWVVSAVEISRLREDVTVDAEGKTTQQSADPVFRQLLNFLDSDVRYIVEFDHEVSGYEIIGPRITIHEMGGLAWRDLCCKMQSEETLPAYSNFVLKCWHWLLAMFKGK